MPIAMTMHEPGGPEVLKPENIEVGEPGPGELHLRQTAVGVNFHDIYVRSGLYQTLPLPGVPGLEGAGEVLAVGEGVDRFRVGDRVAYIAHGYGAYAEERLIKADNAVPLPDGLDATLVAGMMVRGLTARVLMTDVFALKPSHTLLVQAAAGGVGQLLCQWARHLGATVIGTVGSDAKAEQARAGGCDHVILYRQQDVAGAVKEITGGKGWTWPTIRWARTPSTAPWIAWPRAVIWSISASPPDRWSRWPCRAWPPPPHRHPPHARPLHR